MIVTRNIHEYGRLCEGDRIRERELALDPQSVDILNDYTAWHAAGDMMRSTSWIGERAANRHGAKGH
jgi:hypothetical protein